MNLAMEISLGMKKSMQKLSFPISFTKLLIVQMIKLFIPVMQASLSMMNIQVMKKGILNLYILNFSTINRCMPILNLMTRNYQISLLYFLLHQMSTSRLKNIMKQRLLIFKIQEFIKIRLSIIGILMKKSSFLNHLSNPSVMTLYVTMTHMRRKEERNTQRKLLRSNYVIQIKRKLSSPR